LEGVLVQDGADFVEISSLGLDDDAARHNWVE